MDTLPIHFIQYCGHTLAILGRPTGYCSFPRELPWPLNRLAQLINGARSDLGNTGTPPNGLADFYLHAGKFWAANRSTLAVLQPRFAESHAR